MRSRRLPAGAVRAAKFLAGALVVGFVVSQGWSWLSAIDVTDLLPAWLPLVLLAEVLSALAAMGVQAALLGAGRWVRPPASPGAAPTHNAHNPAAADVVRVSLAATAIGYLLPGGPALSAAYAARQFRRTGVRSAAAAQSQVAMAGAAGVALGAVALAGLAIPRATREAGLDPGPALVSTVAAAVMLLGSLAVLVVLQRPGSRRRFDTSTLVRWVTGAPPADPAEPAGHPPPRLSTGRLATCCGLSVLVLLFDCGCLLAALVAARVPVPWTSVLLAYGVAQLLSLVPITPGGVGLVEGGLGALLVAPSAPDGAVALAVVLYRGVSWGLMVAAGGAALVLQRRADLRR